MSDYVQERFRESRKAELIRKGASEEQAEKILRRQEKSARETGRIFFGLGVFMLGFGLLATVGTFILAAAKGGGVFVLTLGLIAGGVGNIAYGRARMQTGA